MEISTEEQATVKEPLTMGNVQISYDVLLSNFKPPPTIWRYFDVYSQPHSPYDVFN